MTFPHQAPVPGRRARPFPHGRSAWAAAALVIALAAWSPTGASAGVVRVAQEGEGTKHGRLVPTLIAPDGTRRELAPAPTFDEVYDEQALTPNPAGTQFIHASGASGLTVRGTDGSPAQVLRGATPRRQWFPPTVWWGPDGTTLAAAPAKTRGGTSAVRRCSMVTLTCRLDPIGAREVVGALADGRLLEATTYGALEPLMAGEDQDWADRSTAWVRRQRRLVGRRFSSHLSIDAGPGTRRMVLRDLSSRPRELVTDVVKARQGPAPSSDGSLIAWDRERLQVETRRRAGRLQARVAHYGAHGGWWLVSAAGTIRPLPEVEKQGVYPSAAVPGEGWLGAGPESDTDDTVSVTVRHTPVPPVVRISLAGRVTPLELQGRTLTARRLHDALGLPAADRPAPDTGGSSWPEVVTLQGYETATRSAVLSYGHGNLVTTARVPLDGSRPTVVDQVSDPSVSYVAF